MECIDGTLQSRQDAEIELLQAMYPDKIRWNAQRHEMSYTTETGAILTLRLPDEYPESAGPVLISALTSNKDDLRDLTRSKIANSHASLDGEVLDTIVQTFEDLVDEAYNNNHHHSVDHTEDGHTNIEPVQGADACKTVIIWLHHLLNTNKRKLASHPSIRGSEIVGVTKPGYPGIVVISGSTEAIDSHVAELKSQRWQAFQVRFEEPCLKPWLFSHLAGIQEMESMSEVAQAIADPVNKEIFLRAVHIK